MNLTEEHIPKNWGHRVAAPHSPALPEVPLKAAILENEAGDTYRVRIVADPGAPAGALARLPDELKKQGYANMYADVWQGQHVLVVRGLKKAEAEQLPQWLQSQSLLPDHAVENHTQSEQDRLKGNLRRDTLKWSGRFAMMGSAAVAIAGAGQKDWSRLQTGLTLVAADSVVAIYGNGKDSINFDRLFHDMHKHFEQNGIHLPNIATPEKRMNAIEQINNIIATHPIELNYGLGMLSGIGHVRSGFGDYQRSGAGISRMVKGALGAGGSAAVIFLPEDKERKKNLKPLSYYLSHPTEIFQGLGDFILASPIRFKGLLSSFYSVLYLTDTLEERKKMKLWADEKGGTYNGKNHAALSEELSTVVNSGAMRNKDETAIAEASELRKGITELERRERIAQTTFGGTITPYLSAFTGICYIASSLLAAASSRNRDSSFEHDSEFERMYAMAAQTVAMVPKEDQQNALTQIATYLSSQKDVKGGDIKTTQIMQEVTDRLKLIDQSPWLTGNAKAASMHI